MFLKSKSGEFINLAHVHAMTVSNNTTSVGSFRLHTSNGAILFEFETQNAFEEALEQLELMMPAKADWAKVGNLWLRADKIQCVKEFEMELQIRMTNESFGLYAKDSEEMQNYKDQIERSLTSSYALETIPM